MFFHDYGLLATRRQSTASVDMAGNETQSFLFNFSLGQAAYILEEYLLNDRIFNPITEIILIACYSILIVTGIGSNVLISAVIMTRRQIRSNARNVYIVNLSITDLALCLFCMPFTLMELLRRSWNLDVYLCKFVPFVQGSIIFVLAATVSAIALDRHYTIVSTQCLRPVSSRKGYMRTLSVTVIIWTVSLALSMPIYFSKTVISVGLPDLVVYYKCIEQWPSKFSKSIYTLVVMGAQFVIPTTVLVVTHFRIKAHLQTSILQQSESSSISRSEQLHRELSRNHRATMVLLYIFVVFAVSWLPWNILNVVVDFHPHTMSPTNLYLSFAVCHILAMSSATTNPILYGWLNTNIHRELNLLRQRVSSVLLSYRSTNSDNQACHQDLPLDTGRAQVIYEIPNSTKLSNRQESSL